MIKTDREEEKGGGRGLLLLKDYIRAWRSILKFQFKRKRQAADDVDFNLWKLWRRSVQSVERRGSIASRRRARKQCRRTDPVAYMRTSPIHLAAGQFSIGAASALARQDPKQTVRDNFSPRPLLSRLDSANTRVTHRNTHTLTHTAPISVLFVFIGFSSCCRVRKSGGTQILSCRGEKRKEKVVSLPDKGKDAALNDSIETRTLLFNIPYEQEESRKRNGAALFMSRNS